MILPVFAYGHPVLREKCADVNAATPDLAALVNDMFETMYATNGVGLAAPQIGKALRVFVVDTAQIEDDEKRRSPGVKKVFFNARILSETGKMWAYEEGCLSIPFIRGDVSRHENVRIRYHDENWVQHEDVYFGLDARVVQHEYDHIEGKLFIDKLSPMKKQIIRRKLDAIKTGQIDPDYKMRFAPPPRR